MTVLQYLELQPVEPQDDGSISELDQFAADETINLDDETDAQQLIQEWDEIERDLQANAEDDAPTQN